MFVIVDLESVNESFDSSLHEMALSGNDEYP
jgi:hypothetical protein